MTDPYLWLEDITGDDALGWVREHNEPTLAELSDERFERMRAEALEVLDTDSRVPYVRRRGDHLYNFWRDAANPKGLWRRTTLNSYRTDAPDWDVVIDLDATTNWRSSACPAAAQTPRWFASSTCAQ
jgi:prolyl oligopeptidase